MGGHKGFSCGAFSALDNARGFAYSPRRVARCVPQWIALASVVSACSGTLPGVGPEPAPVAVRQSSPGVVTRTVMQEGVAPRAVRQRPAEPAPGPAVVSAAPVPATAMPYSAAPPSAAVQTSATPPVMTPNEVRDRQIDLLTEAVSALRQEVARSYEHSQRLTQENEKLRGVVASLRRELAKAKGSNEALKDHLQALEKRMRELRPPPLGPSGGAKAAPNAPSAQAPEPPSEASQGAPPTEEGGLDTGAPAQGD